MALVNEGIHLDLLFTSISSGTLLLGIFYWIYQIQGSSQTTSTTDASKQGGADSWEVRLRHGLSRARQQFVAGLKSVEAKAVNRDALEELLLSADFGPKATEEILESWERTSKSESVDFTQEVRSYLERSISQVQRHLVNHEMTFPLTIMMVGINGAGKTTTCGKLAAKWVLEGKKVVLGACDTFRAAADEQLSTWATRSGATLVRGKEGTPPAAVAFDTVKESLNLNADICLLDTAGRLHTAKDLMEELKKTKLTAEKLLQGRPFERWLVIDAVTGQNALKQAKEFHDYLSLTGIIITKCDGSSKVGTLYQLTTQLNLPIVYVGVGEALEDLERFNLQLYLDKLLAIET